MDETHHELDVSVVMCVRNGEAWIARQLGALAEQSFGGTWEVVVVDNGSSDQTLAVVQACIPEFSVPLRIVDASTRPGVSHARNQGAMAARGRTLAYCDCDDVVADGWVAAAHRGTVTASLVGGINRELREPFEAESSVLNPGAIIRASFGNSVLGCNFAMRRSDYFLVGGFDESLPPYGCDDVEFCIRVNAAGLVVAPAEDMVVHFRKTTGLRAILRKTYWSSIAETVVWARHHELYGQELNARTRVTEVVRWPVDAVRASHGGNRSEFHSLVRDLVVRVGRLVGYMTRARSGAYDPPRLCALPSEPASN